MEKLTNAETNDENGNREESSLVADAELVSYTVDIGSDDGGTKGDDETGGGDHHGTVPLVPFRPVLWVSRVSFHKCDELIVLLCLASFGDLFLGWLWRPSRRGRCLCCRHGDVSWCWCY